MLDVVCVAFYIASCDVRWVWIHYKFFYSFAVAGTSNLKQLKKAKTFPTEAVASSLICGSFYLCGFCY